MRHFEFYTNDYTPFTLRVRYEHFAREEDQVEHCKIKAIYIGETSVMYPLEVEADAEAKEYAKDIKAKRPVTGMLEDLAATALNDFHSQKFLATV